MLFVNSVIKLNLLNSYHGRYVLFIHNHHQLVLCKKSGLYKVESI